MDKLKTWWEKKLLVSPRMQFYTFKIIGQVRSIGAFVVNRHFRPKSDLDFVFIVGSGRSGNTLLRKLLMERSSIYIPPESYVIPSAVKGVLAGGGLSWNDEVDLFLARFEYYPEFETFGIDSLRKFAIGAKSWPKNERSIGLLLSRLYFWIASKKGLDVLAVGDKTPLNTMNLGLLDRILPKAKYIYIERDGVDVAVSYVKAGIYENIVDAATRWKDSKCAWRAFRKNLAIERYCEVRYESLVTEPERVLEEIIGCLALPRRNENENVTRVLGDIVMTPHLTKVLSPVNTHSIGAGRKWLSESDAMLVA